MKYAQMQVEVDEHKKLCDSLAATFLPYVAVADTAAHPSGRVWFSFSESDKEAHDVLATDSRDSR